MNKVYGILDDKGKWLSFSNTKPEEESYEVIDKKEQKIIMAALVSTRDYAEHLIKKLTSATIGGK